MTSVFSVGLLGHGTVGSAFAELLAERADAIERDHRPAPGALRRADALARRLRGDPRGLGPDRRADRRHRARARLRAAGDARRPPRRDRQQAAALPARRGAVGGRARARRAAALRGRGGRRRAGHPRAPGVARRPRTSSACTGSSTARRTSSSPRWRATGAQLRRGARPRPSGSATPRPTRPRTSTARTRRRRWRSSRGWPSTRRCTSTRSATRASSTSRADDLEYARELGLGLKLIGTAERIDGGLSRARAPGLPLRRATRWPRSTGPFNAVTVESAGDHRDHDVRARARAARRPRAPCSAT